MKKKMLSVLLFALPYQQILASSAKEIFTQVYEQGLWFSDETFSGQGSRLVETPIIRQELPILLRNLGIKTLLDAGCGDFNWLKVTELPIENYIGVDIVPSLIENNKKKYENERRKFFSLDIANDQIPKADAILCRDVLNHLPLQDVMKSIQHFNQSGAKYLLVTIQIAATENIDIAHAGPWRQLNFFKAPFNFPAPKYLIHEGNCEANAGKGLAVWLLDEISN